MPSYIADRYAATLTTEDTASLFDALTDKLHGNRSEAARQCDLTGKTTYDWEKASYVKINTRRKVLEACLRIDFLSTVEYLLKRSNERATDILRTVLSTIYAEAVETRSAEEFAVLLERFETLTSEYRGLVYDKIKDEVTDMLWTLKQRAQELKVSARQKSIDDISARELLQFLPLLAEMYLSRPKEAPMIAETLDFPRESIEMLWPTFEKLRPAEEAMTEATIGIMLNVRPDEREVWGLCKGGTPATVRVPLVDRVIVPWSGLRSPTTPQMSTSSERYDVLICQSPQMPSSLPRTEAYGPKVG